MIICILAERHILGSVVSRAITLLWYVKHAAQLVVRALYDFDQRQKDDLEFRKGDRLTIINKTSVNRLINTRNFDF